MSPWLGSAIVAAYASWVFELALLHVPSVASSRRIWSSPHHVVVGYSPAIRRVFSLPRVLKVLLFGVPLLVIYAVYAYPLLVLWFGPNLMADYVFIPTRITNVVGVTLLLVGRTIAIKAAATIRRHNEQRGDSFHLHVGGPFRWSRNPGLVGMYAFASGLWVLTPSLAMLLGIGLYAAYMDFKVRMEEDFLANKFGHAYADYLRRTGRYLP